MKLQVFRRILQLTVLLVAVAMPILSLYAHYRAAGSIDDPALMAGLRGEVVTQYIHPALDKLKNPEAFLEGNRGTLWSMRLLGVNLSDPLAALEMLATSKTWHRPMILSIAIPVLITLILGRVFCSWICPAYLLFEVTGKLRKLLRIAEIQPGEVHFAHTNKYVFLVAGLCLAAIVSAPLFALIYPPAVISRVLHAWVFGTALTGMVVLLLLIVAVELLVSPRWWCRTMCPGGALYALLGWARPVRIRLKTSQCTGCRECIAVCEAGINPITQSTSIECDNCGVCLRHCEPQALYYTIGLPDMHKAHAVGRASSSASSARTALVLLAALVPWGFASPAVGHHILGLPHYSYKENYPQRPTLEYPARTGPYDILLTSYPGVPVPGEPANLAFYIKNRETNAVYSTTISMRILQTSTFGDNQTIVPSTQRDPFDNEYKYYVTFPADGEYIVELSLPVEGRVEVIPFLMVAGEPTAFGSFIVAGCVGAVVLLIAVRAWCRKRRRKAAAARCEHQGVSAAAEGALLTEPRP